MRFPSGVLVLFLLTLSACKKGGDAPSPPQSSTAPEALEAAPNPERTPVAPEEKKAAKAGPARGTADLVLTGAITQELKGPIVTCGYTRLEGRDQGGTWAIRTEDFDFQIMATSDKDFAEPAAVLNARKPTRISYVFKRKAGKVSAKSDRTVAEIDADLRNVVGKETVHVKGTMTCPEK
jgi:hypothetical protein